MSAPQPPQTKAAPAASATPAQGADAADVTEATEAPETHSTTNLVAQVIVEQPIGVLDYAVPAALQHQLAIGMVVLVPLGRRQTHAWVTALQPAPVPATMPLKDIVSIDDSRPMLPKALLELIIFASRYYAAPPGDMLGVALPAMARSRRSAYRVSALGQAHAQTLGAAVAGDSTDAAAQPQPAEAEAAADKSAAGKPRNTTSAPVRLTRQAVLLWAVQQPRGFTSTALVRALKVRPEQAMRAIRSALQQGWLEALTRVAHKPRMMLWARRTPLAAQAETLLGKRQKRALALLQAWPEAQDCALSTLRQIDDKARAAVVALRKAGLVETWEQEMRCSPWDAAADAISPEPPKVLSEAQAQALQHLGAALLTQQFGAFLLHGATGSGKTEVYLRAIDQVLKSGKTALVLVPEIALTPQLGARFRDRFGAQVATFHSGLSVAERRDEWERVATGEARIGLGARSALFLPLENLGIIIIDEEHETSFKQEDSPRYHARDLAVWRARQADAVIVLGSATPSLETWYNAERGRYTKLSMPDRVAGRPLPKVDLISLKDEPKVGESLLTQPLIDALKQTFARGEQAILFLNRRGFAPYVFCRDCAHPFRCLHCEVSLTLHQRRGLLLCHYCGHTERVPDTCPACLGHRVGAFGLGTERLEAEVKQLFAEVPVVRLDRDTVRTRGDIEQALKTFRTGQAPLMIGTQMVAKGHDFPGVTLVGVVAADSSLNFPDFRAAERTFQLLTQVAGRAGRGGKVGRVLVQAYETDHYAVVAAQKHDYLDFVRQELAFRQELGYPPFAHLALLRFEGDAQEEVLQQAQAEVDILHAAAPQVAPGVQILGPAPAPLSRLRGLWRVHVLFKADDRQALRRLLNLLPNQQRQKQRVRRRLDIDPVSML